MATKTTTRKTHAWTPEQMTFLADRPTMNRDELEKAFRKAFPKFTGSQQALVGKRYTLLHKGSAKHPDVSRRSLEARIAEVREELATLEARLDAMNDPDADFRARIAELNEMTLTDLRAAAKAAGVKANGSRNDIAARILAVS